MAAAHSLDFQTYLRAVCTNDKYRRWRNLYTPTYAEGRFDFDLMVKGPRSLQQGGQVQEKTERLPVLEGLRKYASKHVLLVGRPGLGKSTALRRLLLEEAERARGDEKAKVPVLIELRYYRDSVLDLIQSFFKGHRLRLSESQVEDLLFEGRLLLLVDGLNELPYAEDAWRDLTRFHEENVSTAMVFTARDLTAGSNLGIEKTLEMQPLTAAQMQQFIMAYLPDKGDHQMLRQLGGRLQGFGQTPLLLWMLCSQFAQRESIPANLGLMFREFTQTYKKDALVSDESRRWWTLLLQHLAFEMTQGHNSTEMRVAIPRREAEEILTRLLRAENFDKPRDRALSWLKDLLDHHLIQLGTSNQIEFHHQLIQEYYAAESLLQLLPHISHDRLKRDYLNYLKWTEPLALMLALMDQEPQARKVVKLALEVDLKLGARLAGAVEPKFQNQMVDLIAGLEIPQLLKIQLLGITRSGSAIPAVRQALSDQDSDVRWRAVEALGEIGDEAAVTGLRQALSDQDSGVRWRAVEALGEIGDEAAVTGLRQALSDQDSDVRWRAVEALGEIGDEAAVTGLQQALSDQDSGVRWRAVEALGEIGDEAAVTGLQQALSDQDSDVRQRAVEILGEIRSEAAVTGLQQALSDQDSDVRWRAVEALGEIGDEAALKVLQQALNDQDADVRRRAVEALGEIGDEAAVTGLQQALSDQDSDVRQRAVEILGEIRSEAAVTGLRQALSDQDSGVRWRAVEALGEIGDEAALKVLQQALNDQDADVRRRAVEALGEIGDEAAVTGLQQALSDQDSDIRQRAVETLGEIRSEASLKVLLQALNDQDTDVRRRAVEALGKIGSPKLLPQLSQLLLKGNLSSNLLNTIAAIQEHCKYYNHSLVESSLPREGQDSDPLIEVLDTIIQILKPMLENLRSPSRFHLSKTIKSSKKVRDSYRESHHTLPQNLAEAAAEIQQLVDQLAQAYPVTIEAEKRATLAKAIKQQIQYNPLLKQQSSGALIEGSIEY